MSLCGDFESKQDSRNLGEISNVQSKNSGAERVRTNDKFYPLKWSLIHCCDLARTPLSFLLGKK